MAKGALLKIAPLVFNLINLRYLNQFSMKKIFLVFFICLIAVQVKAQLKLAGEFNIKLDISLIKEQPKYVYLSYVSDSKVFIRDSSMVKSGIVYFKGIISEPESAFISLWPNGNKSANKNNRLIFYLEPENITITSIDSLTNFKIKGGLYSKEFEALNDTNQYYNKKLNGLNPIIRKHEENSEGYKKAAREYKYLFDHWVNEVQKDFVIKYGKTSPVSLIALKFYTGFDIEYPKTADSLYNLLNDQFKQLSVAKPIKEKIDKVLTANVGNIAPIISEPDTSGNDVSLLSFRGKYVLLDFWASWCIPCRAENPNLVKNYEKYKNRNFTILSVSMDRESGKSAWLNAIRSDHVGLWTHVSELKMFDDKAAKLYGITGIPQNFLIDPSGKIIAKNLRGPELTAKLIELFGKMK
jgi:thiol-disulfide isomerase/thioredoxin